MSTEISAHVILFTCMHHCAVYLLFHFRQQSQECSAHRILRVHCYFLLCSNYGIELVAELDLACYASHVWPYLFFFLSFLFQL